jgi:hypothetical protein
VADSFSATVVSPAGNEYVLTSPVEYYNLRAQGYADKSPKESAKAVESTEKAATAQGPTPADGASGRATA